MQSKEGSGVGQERLSAEQKKMESTMLILVPSKFLRANYTALFASSLAS